MAPKTSAPIRRALVRAVRSAPVYSSLLGFFNGFAPEDLGVPGYPFAVYNQVPTPYEDDWTSRMIVAVFDIFVFSRNSVEADNLDQAIADALEQAQLTVDGMDSLMCHRIADVPMPPDVDEQGKRIYQVGGTYEIWTDQPR
jgi:hypothetical protein